ncbi:MAG: hypothetical protein II939_00700 [Bacteroidales bacterium]|nr:hypothetical protein [Bacteroidales bacterium]
MNTFEIRKIHFIKRYFLSFFSGKTWFIIILFLILACTCKDDIFIILGAFSPIALWLILWSFWISYKYLYKIEICDNEILFYLQVFNKIKIHKRDIPNTRVYFSIGDPKSRSRISFGGKVKGYFYKESLGQWFVCDWGIKYKDLAKFLSDNNIWHNLQNYKFPDGKMF